MKPEKIGIIGGGIGGLCAAIALQQSGFDASVYEKVNQLGEVGAGLTLWPNAIKVLRALGLADAVIAAGSKLDRSQIRSDKGDMLFNAHAGDMQKKYGEPVIAIHRADLHQILVAALKPDTLKLNMFFSRFEQDTDKVTIHFENGKTEQAGLLIGADGINSAVRRQMFPQIQLRYSGYSAWRGIVETKDESALGLTSESWGTSARFGIIRIDKSRIYWFATVNQPMGEKITGAEMKEKLLARYTNWHDPIRYLLDSTPANAILQNDISDIKPFESWTTGRITLLGDSAHPTTPNMGQGACMAIESAYALSRSLKEEKDYPSALTRYGRERHPRTKWITNTSWIIGRGTQVNNPYLCAARDFITKFTPAFVIQSHLHQAAGYDVTRVDLKVTN